MKVPEKMEGQTASEKQTELSPAERVEKIDQKIGSLEEKKGGLTASVEGTLSALGGLREELALPPTEGIPDSVRPNMEKIGKIGAEERSLEDEKEKLLRKEREQAEQAALWLEVVVKEQAPVPPEKRECGPEVKAFEEMIVRFEAEHPLAELHAVTSITEKQARERNHPVRNPAEEAIRPIFKMLEKLKNETNISPEEIKRLTDERKRLSRAIGMTKTDYTIDHTR